MFSLTGNSVMELTCRFKDGGCSGSGYLITDDGYGITNAHVVSDGKTYEICKNVQVKLAGETVNAIVVAVGDKQAGSGKGVDLALIKLSRVPSKARCVQFENSGNVRNGETVYVIGNSLGYGNCITRGIVSDRARNVNGKILLMTDCAVNGGNSGGPMFNESGKVIGTIVSGITQAEGMNFALQSDDVVAFIKRVK